jgi:uncharacterized protein YjdB
VPPYAGITVAPASISAVPGDTVRIRLTDGRGRPIDAFALEASTGAVRVGAGGLVTAAAPGSAILTVLAVVNGQTATASVPVTVLGLTLDPTRGALSVGGALTIRPTLVGPAPAFGTIGWASSDTTVATVGADGTVRGVGVGVARIAAVASADPPLRAEAEVAVLCIGPVLQSLAVDRNALVLQPGDTAHVVATVTFNPCAPATTPRGVRYASSDTTVVTVSATGLITARRNGTAVITVVVAAAPTVTQLVTVTVREPGLARLDTVVPLGGTATARAISPGALVPTALGSGGGRSGVPNPGVRLREHPAVPQQAAS